MSRIVANWSIVPSIKSYNIDRTKPSYIVEFSVLQDEMQRQGKCLLFQEFVVDGNCIHFQSIRNDVCLLLTKKTTLLKE